MTSLGLLDGVYFALVCPRRNDSSPRLLDGVDLLRLPDGHARLDDEDAREQRDAVVGPGPQVLGKLHAGRAERAEGERELRDPAGNFGAVPVRTSSTGSDGTASKAEAKARAAAEELARLKAAAEKRASQQRRRRARRTRSAKAT